MIVGGRDPTLVTAAGSEHNNVYWDGEWGTHTGIQMINYRGQRRVGSE